jgi:hypothetical protein
MVYGGVVLGMAVFFAGTPARAEQKFEPKQVIGGANGKWKQAIEDKPILRIDCQVERVSGGDDVFINFRFADDGKTFPGGKRFPVNKDQRIKVEVPGNGVRSGGKPLVVNAYNGQVRLVSVVVHFQE